MTDGDDLPARVAVLEAKVRLIAIVLKSAAALAVSALVTWLIER